MEINYDLIIKYLVSNKNTFTSKKHILVFSDLFPEKFKNIFQNKFYRYGVNQNNGFYNTILTLLNKNFITFTNDEELYEVNIFKKSINKELNLIELPNYLKNIDKKQVLNKIDEFHIQILSEILGINFIIFNFNDSSFDQKQNINETIKIIYSGEICNPYKITLLIANFENFYEPIICETDNKKLFSYNDIIIKKIYQSDINVFLSLNKNFKLNDELNNLIIELNNQNNIDNNTLLLFSKENESVEHNEDIELSKLNKMLKKDLEEILLKKKIKYSSKMLKKDLINLILN